MPRIEPRPPNSEMPPITTAVMDSILANWPEVGETEPMRPMSTQPAKAADEAGEHVDGDQHAVDVDAGELGGVGIVADRIDVAAPGGVVEHVPEDDHQQHHDDDAVGEDRAAEFDLDAEELQQRRLGLDVLGADRLVARNREVGRAVDLPGAQRDDEGRQLHLGDQHSR